VHFDSVFNRHKPKWDTDFTVQSRNEAYNNSAKTVQKFKVRSKGVPAVTKSPPPQYATVARLWCCHEYK